MVWLAPAAFVGFALLAGPLVVHLLARRNARRLVFPATHFVRATQAAAVRLRRPSDVGLMLLRLAIVSAAVLAAAQPLLLNRWRLARWNARTARAVIVDTISSAGSGDGQSRPGSTVANRVGDDALQGAFAGVRFNTSDVSDGLARAVEWLRTTPPARREIVIVSGFQNGALDEASLQAIPSDVGVRLVRAGSPPAERRVVVTGVDGWRGGTWDAAVTIDPAGTQVSWQRRGGATAAPWLSVAAAPADAAAAERALTAALSLGVSAGNPDHHALVRFAGAPPLAPAAHPIRAQWIAAAVLALRESELIEDSHGLTTAERDGAMIVGVPFAASAIEAAALVRAVALAIRAAAIVGRDAEVATWSDAELARWQRDASPVAKTAIPTGSETDSRWAWAIALALLIFEWRARRPGAATAERDAHADAA